MKPMLKVLMIAAFLIGTAALTTAEMKGDRLVLEKGDQVFVCACGEGCPCDTISNKPGKCTCDRDLARGTVEKVGGGEATITYTGHDGKSHTESFKTVGKYVCACGPGCDCDYISQEPGKCACGVMLKQVDE